MFALAPLAILALALGVRADLVVSTPASITQCSSVTFQISGSSTGPFYAFVVDSTNPCGDALAEIDNISGTSFTWTPNVPSGTSVMIALEADDGTEGWSGAVTIGAGDSSCLTGASSSSSSAASSSSSSSHAASTARSGTTYVAPENVAPSASVAQDQSPTSGASRSVVGVSSIVALVGAAVAALSL